MEKSARIFVAGHRGLVGSAIVRGLKLAGYINILTRTHADLDLTDSKATSDFFAYEKPNYVFLAAAKVGGILANNTYPANFIRENLVIQTNVIHEAFASNAKRLLFLGSSCIYPRNADQPIKERYLLTGPLESTNRPYAIAKIAGIEMCWSYNRQCGTRFLAAMPTNLYGAGDNYDLANSHVIPALLRKFDQAKRSGATEAVVWGTGTPRREFMFSDDMASACIHLMRLEDARFDSLLATSSHDAGRFEPPLVNVGVDEDITIAGLAEMVAKVVGFEGNIVFDVSKPDGTMRKLMDSSRLRETGWRPRVDLFEGLKSAYEDYTRHVLANAAA